MTAPQAVSCRLSTEAGELPSFALRAKWPALSRGSTLKPPKFLISSLILGLGRSHYASAPNIPQNGGACLDPPVRHGSGRPIRSADTGSPSPELYAVAARLPWRRAPATRLPPGVAEASGSDRGRVGAAVRTVRSKPSKVRNRRAWLSCAFLRKIMFKILRKIMFKITNTADCVGIGTILPRVLDGDGRDMRRVAKLPNRLRLR